MSKKVITGIEQGYYAIMTDMVTETYATVKPLGELIEIGVKPQEKSTSLWAGNREVLLESGLGGVDVTFTVPALETDTICELFGKTLADTGGYISNSRDVKPYVCLMFKKTLDSGADEYLFLYKGKLNIAEEKAKTQEGNVDFQPKQFEGKFVTLQNGIWMYSVRSTDADFDATTFQTKWGKEVIKAQAKVVTP